MGGVCKCSDKRIHQGQLLSSWLELYYHDLLGKRAERTCHYLRSSCSPYTRSIPLLPASRHNSTALLQRGAFKGYFKEGLFLTDTNPSHAITLSIPCLQTL